MDISDLNQEQQAAVKHDQGPLLVVAGAGTGKTSVITRRIAYLISERGVKPEAILALTFTEKAAGEMLDRLDTLIGWQAYRVNVMTFHAFGAQTLSRFGHHAGWSSRTEVVSDTAKLVLLKRHLSDIKLSYYGAQNDILDFLGSALKYIQTLQNADVSPDRFEAFIEEVRQGKEKHELDVLELEDRLKIYRLYEQLKAQYNVIDYDDQIRLTLQLLQQKPNICASLQAEYQYVLVDEYQDTNRVQDTILRELVPPKGNIFAVGDDDQAIYGFRGAQIDNILNFASHFGVKQPVVLTQNYRSSVEILDAAYQLIQHNNPDRLETRLGINKQLQAQFAGSRPSFQPAADSRDEYQLVTSVIEAQLASGRKTDNIAVLSTTHGSLRSLARVLRQKHISYQLTSNLNVFEQPEIVQLWHLLRWIGLTQDDDAILQLLLGPFIEWSPEQVRQVAEPSKHELITLEEAITKLAASDNADALAVATNLVQWRSWAAELTVSQLVYKLIFESGLSDRWIAAVDDTPRLVHVFEDLQLWLRQMQEYETVALDPRLAGYLSTFPIPPEIETEVKTGDELGVKLLTIHASKGLEFETVIIMNNTQTAWSERNGGLQNQPPEELTSLAEKLPPEHERRRLLYVAMTRAKQELYFTAPTLQKGGRNRKLSPFLSEIFNETELKVEIDPVVQNNLQITLSNLQRYAPLLEQNTGIKLPFESSDGWLSLSATQVDAYERCAYEFYLLHVLKISLPLGPQLQFGSLLHGLFHRYYEAKLAGEPVTIQELQERLTEQWSDRGYPSVRAAELALSTARTTLQNFFDREEIEKRVIRSTEESIVLKIDEAKLRIEGRIDATFITDSGVEVRDFKTGRKHDPEKLANDAKASLQLRTYALAIEAMEGRAPTSVVLDYVVTGTEGRAELSATILKNHRAKLAGIAEKIRAGEFAPSTDAFHNCIVGKFWGNPDMEDDNA